MSEHTAGPWKPVIMARGSHGIESSDACMIAITHEIPDAHLIAAAPELLGLLKDIELALKAGNLRKPNQWRDRISEVIRKTQVAI